MTTGEQSAGALAQASEAALAKKETVIQARSGWSALQLGEIWDYRDLLITLIWRDLQARYRQMALGPLWIIIQPLLSMVLYTVIFGSIAQLPSEGVPYAVFAYVALLPWGVFTDSVSAASNSLLSNKNLLDKVYFPRLIPVIAKYVTSLVDFSISFLILIAMLVAYNIRPNAGVLLIPVFLLVAGFAGIAVGLWFAGIIVRFRDFTQVAGLLVRFWMYATPVVYSISIVPDAWLDLYRLNPMTGVVEGFRWALVGTGQPPGWIWVFGVLLFVPIFIAGLYQFKRVERSIVDVA